MKHTGVAMKVVNTGDSYTPVNICFLPHEKYTAQLR